jgi:alpha-mannosidase
LQETAGKAAQTRLRLPRSGIVSAELCSGVENKLQDLPVAQNEVRLSFNPFEVITVRIISR